MAAAEGNHENVCRLLVDRGAEMDAWDYVRSKRRGFAKR
jgi:hypothetical protein